MSCGTAPSLQQRQRSSWRGSRRVELPDLITSGGMPSLPGAFWFENASMAFSSSLMVGSASRGFIELRAASVTTVSRRYSSMSVPSSVHLLLGIFL